MACRIYVENGGYDSDACIDESTYMEKVINKSISAEEYFNKENYSTWLKKQQESALSEYYGGKVQLIK